MAARLRESIKSLFRYKSFIIGLFLITIFIVISVYAITTIPYGKAIRMWNSIEYWEDYPKLAFPAWINEFSPKKLPEGTIILDSRKKGLGITKTVQRIEFGGVGTLINIDMRFTYKYDDFPSEITMWFYVNTTEPMLITITWVKPDGTEVLVVREMLSSYQYYRLTGDIKFISRFITELANKLGKKPNYEMSSEIALFAKEDETILNKETVHPVKGKYVIKVEARTGDSKADLDVKVDIYGKVYGLLGTDDKRRYLVIGILWGAPLALSFGVLASVATVLLQMIIAAIAAWYGRWVDHLVSRVNEVVMIIPFLPLLIMISYFYRFSIWTLLVVVVALSAFGPGVKTYRAMFLQVKEMPYIEAAQAYGASNSRIILRYMVPKVLPTIVPNIVLSVPSFVFLEAALAILGVGDPQAITWGKILDEAYTGGALYWGRYHWILAPSLCLVLISIGFALMGFTLDRVFNPRLREM